MKQETIYYQLLINRSTIAFTKEHSCKKACANNICPLMLRRVAVESAHLLAIVLNSNEDAISDMVSPSVILSQNGNWLCTGSNIPDEVIISFPLISSINLN